MPTALRLRGLRREGFCQQQRSSVPLTVLCEHEARPKGTTALTLVIILHAYFGLKEPGALYVINPETSLIPQRNQKRIFGSVAKVSFSWNYSIDDVLLSQKVSKALILLLREVLDFLYLLFLFSLHCSCPLCVYAVSLCFYLFIYFLFLSWQGLISLPCITTWFDEQSMTAALGQ